MRILRSAETWWWSGDEGGAVAEVMEALLLMVVPLSPTQSSWRRSQLRQPLGRPSHLTCDDGESLLLAMSYTDLTLRALQTRHPMLGSGQ